MVKRPEPKPQPHPRPRPTPTRPTTSLDRFTDQQKQTGANILARINTKENHA